MQLSRRNTLLGLSVVASLGRAALALGRSATEQRFVVVILRGAMDGLAAVAPYGDAGLAALRAPLLSPPPGENEGLLDLGGFYGLHPALTGLHQLYRNGELLPVHAVASSDRSRSHFQAQDTLELGTRNLVTHSGWLNRAAGLISVPDAVEPALAIGSVTPLLLRGPTPVGSWMPSMTPPPPAGFYAQLAALHAGDSLTGQAIALALKERGFSAAALAGTAPAPNRMAFPSLCAAAGKLLAASNGPRLAAVELEGWDTHAHQPTQLAIVLRALDSGLMALRSGLDTAWAQTVVLVITEFGRTARVNGSMGTDHGTGSVAFVLGGKVAGGRVRADWPGLKPAQLFQDRDLQPTADLRAVAKGILADHLGLSADGLAQVFPDSGAVSPMRGLMRG
jgi:uncharacterized protein (DUF1501 family)